MSPPPAPEAPAGTAFRVRIANGSLYLARELCDRYLPGTTSLATIARDGRVFLLPLNGSTAGGSLMKVRNAHGDRVVHADEFLRGIGLPPDAPERWVEVRWVTEMAGLVLDGVATNAAAVASAPGGAN